MSKEKSIITPWEVSGDFDYSRLIKDFGVSTISKLPKEFSKDILFKRNLIFAQRDFSRIIDAYKDKKKFVMITGLMPSGKFHLGHMLVAKQMIFYQNLGAKLYVAVADLEAYSTRNTEISELRKIAIEEYLTNYIALGLKPKNIEFYFQSERSKVAKKSNAYYSLASLFSRHLTFNEFKSVYGANSLNSARINSSLLQASDMYHAQLKEFEGSVPVVVPVGIDQDPHIRISRDMGKRIKSLKFIPISSTYNKFVPGLKGVGTKMSSSDINSYIALTDSVVEAKKKIMKYAFSGGRDTLKEHKEKGGRPEIDIACQYLNLFFEEDDKKISNIFKEYKSGSLTSGEVKNYLSIKVEKFLNQIQKRRKIAEKITSKFLNS